MTLVSRRAVLAGGAAIVAPARPDFFDGQTVLAGGREIVLTDILAPSSAALWGGAEPWSEMASEALRKIRASGTLVSERMNSLDRWGRAAGAAHWRHADGRETTLQEALLAEGAARVHPQSDDAAMLDRYFAAEDAARGARRGLWALDAYAIRNADDARAAFGFQIYHGKVRSASNRRGRIFFNFGEDFRTDLTATLTQGAFGRWRRKDLIETYAGLTIEVRGLVERINGPSIELAHERQLRLL
ncbi:MAG: thermonuclease family protein [Parvularculaceae bacterium]